MQMPFTVRFAWFIFYPFCEIAAMGGSKWGSRSALSLILPFTVVHFTSRIAFFSLDTLLPPPQCSHCFFMFLPLFSFSGLSYYRIFAFLLIVRFACFLLDTLLPPPQCCHLSSFFFHVSPSRDFPTIVSSLSAPLAFRGRVPSVGGSAMHMKWPDGIGRDAGLGPTRSWKELSNFRACPC